MKQIPDLLANDSQANRKRNDPSLPLTIHKKRDTVTEFKGYKGRSFPHPGYRAECPPKGKFRWNHGRYVRPELRLGAFLFKEVNLLNESHRALAIETVKNILHVLHEKRYQDLPSCVDEMEWADTDEIRECIQGTLELNDFDTFDEYGVPCTFQPEYEYHHEVMFFEYNDGSGFAVDYELTSGGELTYLCLQLKFLYQNGTLKRVFHTIDPQ